MPLKKEQMVIIAFAVAAFSFFVCCNGKAGSIYNWVLELKPREPSAETVEIQVQTGDRVVLFFIHSFNKMPVRETLMVTANGELELKEAEFSQLGVGYDTEPVSGNYRLENGKIHITEMDIRYPKIPLRIGTVAQHQLIVANKHYDLKSLFGGGKRIDIQLKPAKKP